MLQSSNPHPQDQYNQASEHIVASKQNTACKSKIQLNVSCNMSSPKAYQYGSLPSDTCFRLLILHRGAPEDDLQCQIQIYKMSRCPKYEAISYVWGDPTNMATIRVRGSCTDAMLEVPPNLAAGLRRFRRQDSDRVLWADSICINQEDNQEKALQVKIMGNIFSEAGQVLVWLGEDPKPNRAETAYNTMRALQQAQPKFKEERKSSSYALIEQSRHCREDFFEALDQFHQRLGIPALRSPEYQAFKELLNNPWFYRAWTWQESYLAKASTFYCCEWSWPDHLFREAVSMALEVATSCNLAHYFPSDSIISIVLMLNAREIRGGYSFSNLLIKRRGAGCKHPVDHVYSILGAAKECPIMQVDYNVDFEVVFAHATWKTIEKENELSILRYSSRKKTPSHLPSWCPDWRIAKDATFSPTTHHIYKAMGNSLPVGRLSTSSQILSLSGLDWDRISVVIAIKDPLKLFEGIMKYFHAGIIGSHIKSPTEDALWILLCRVLLADVQPLSGRGVFRLTPKSLEELEQIVAGEDAQEETIRLERVRRKLFWLNRNRSIFVTDMGRLGIADDSVLEGDRVAMLLGGNVPFVLRTIDVEARKYSFVADCYVHGFMDGESLVEARKAAQPEHDASDTSWLMNLHQMELPFPVQEFHIY